MRASAKAVTLVPPVAIIGILVAMAQPPWPPYRLIGLGVVLLGLAGLTLARITLGDSFSIAPEARQLVTSGIYSRVRHPVYVFSFIAIAGLFLYIRAPWGCLILIPLGFVQVFRARAEEKILTAKFGDAYTRYKQHTWF